MEDILPEKEISVTTFRDGDRADTGYREALKKLGFAERELLVEFGYPTQRFVLSSRSKESYGKKSIVKKTKKGRKSDIKHAKRDKKSNSHKSLSQKIFLTGRGTGSILLRRDIQAVSLQQ